MRVVIRTSLVDAAIAIGLAFVVAALGLGLLATPFLDIARTTWCAMLAIRLALGVPLGTLFLLAAVSLAALAVRRIYRFVVPNILQFDGDLVRARVASTWSRRTEMWIARASIRDVVLQPNQFAASYDVKLALDDGTAIELAHDASPRAAGRLAAHVEAALDGRRALPVARVHAFGSSYPAARSASHSAGVASTTTVPRASGGSS